MFGCAKGDGLFQSKCGLYIREHDGRGAIRYERTVGTFKRTCHEGILFTLCPAEIVTQVLAHLSVGIADAVLVILGSDRGQRVRLIAPFLEISPGDLAENSCKANVDIRLLAKIR